MAARYLVGLLALSLAVASLCPQEKEKQGGKPASETTAAAPATPPGPHVFTLTPEDAARKNPIKFSEVSVERGKKIYVTQCAMCHGTAGDGKGEMVEVMNIKPPDFTVPEGQKKRTDGELYAIIGMGSPVMPAQGTRMTDNHKWNIVNFIRSLGGKAPEKATGKEPEENIILVPQ